MLENPEVCFANVILFMEEKFQWIRGLTQYEPTHCIGPIDHRTLSLT